MAGSLSVPGMLPLPRASVPMRTVLPYAAPTALPGHQLVSEAMSQVAEQARSIPWSVQAFT